VQPLLLPWPRVRYDTIMPEPSRRARHHAAGGGCTPPVTTGFTAMNMIGHDSAQDYLPPLHPLPVDRFAGTRLRRRAIRGLPIVLAGLVLGSLAAMVLVQVLPPKFTSSVSILIDPKRPGAVGAETEFANMYVDTSKIAGVELILLSSDVLDRVVAAQHLADDPDFGGAHPPLLASLRARLFGGKVTLPPDTPQARADRAEDRLRRMIRTGRIGTTYVIQLDVIAPKAAEAQTLARAVADAYLANQIDTKLDAVRRDTAWLNDRLTTQRAQLIASESKVEALRKKFDVVDSTGNHDLSIEHQSITQVNQELLDAQAKVAASQARYQQTNTVLHSGGSLEGLGDIDASMVIQGLRSQQAAAAQRVADMSARYSTNYPDLIRAKSERAAIDHQVALEVSRVAASLKNDYQISVAHRDALAAQLAGLVATVNAASRAGGRVELNEAERIAEANRISYEATLTRLREVEQQQTRQDAEARIISNPDLPETPSFPKPLMLLPAGAGGGMMLGAGLVVLLSLGRKQVEDAVAAERDLMLPVLSMTPYLPRGVLMAGARKLSIPEYLSINPFSGYAESLRVLRLRLRSSRPGTGPGGGHVIQVTSAIPGEGKSTIAASLAISAAAAGTRTVLVDLDLHHPSAAKLLGHGGSKGVVDIVLGNAQTGTALQTHPDLPIWTVNAGSIASLHPGVLESRQMRELIQGLAEKFDLVVVDSPPVLAISDPLYISTLVDTTIMVVGWRATSQNDVNDALAALRSAQAPLAGIVLNKVNPARAGGYGSNRYGYERTAV
jgi:succinoglycan biosynthesis transport protein ExoP